MFVLFPRLEHTAGWICARYKSLLLLLKFVYSFISNIYEIIVFLNINVRMFHQCTLRYEF